MFNGNGDNGMYMPVAPLGFGGYGGGYGNNGGFFGGDGIWALLVLALLFGGGFGGGWGMGGFGGWGGMMGMDAMMLAPYFFNTQTQNDVNRGFDNSALSNQISGLQSSIDEVRTGNQLSNLQTAVTSGFSDTALGIAGVNQNICQTGAGITAAVTNGFAQAEIADNARQMANMQQAFNSQTAITGGLTNLSSQFADCCCENRLGLANLGADLAREACADRAAVTDGVRDILANQNAGIQRILDQMCSDKIDAKNEKIVELQNQLAMKDLAASQTAQTARLLADNAAQTQQIENYVRPQINPAYIVPNPYAYNFPYGYNNGNWGGCNNGCGCGNNFNGNF